MPPWAWSRQGHPRYTGVPKGMPSVAQNDLHKTIIGKQHNKNKDKPWVNRVFRHKCSHIVILYSCTVAETVLETADLWRCCQTPRTNTSSTQSKWRSTTVIKKTAQRNGTDHPGGDRPCDQALQGSYAGTRPNTSSSIRIRTLTRVVDMYVAMQRQVLQIQTVHRKSWEGRDPTNGFWVWTSDTMNVHVDALWKTLEMKARSFAEDHGRKRCTGLGQRWLSVSQQYDQSEQQDRERVNLDQSFRQQGCVSAFWIQTLTLSCTRSL